MEGTEEWMPYMKSKRHDKKRARAQQERGGAEENRQVCGAVGPLEEENEEEEREECRRRVKMKRS